MRLPEFLTELSPVRETLAALEQGENAMAEAVAASGPPWPGGAP